MRKLQGPSFTSTPFENGSIHATLVANPSTPLYTNPLAWQKEHLQHLRCELHPPLQCSVRRQNDMTSDDAKSHGLEWRDDARGMAMLVQSCRTKKERDEYMRTLFTSLSFAATPSKPRSYPLTFFYNRRPVVRLGSPLLVFCDEQLGRNSAWAYVDETWSSEQRFSFYNKQRRNCPFGYAMRATLEARDSLLEPLYVAIFIALAQRLREKRQLSERSMSQTISIFVPKHTTPATQSNPTNTRSRALVTSLTRYTANITEDYLLKFDDLYHSHQGTLHIYQTSIPIELPSAIFNTIQEASDYRSSKAKRKQQVLCDISEETANKSQRIGGPPEELNEEKT